jgi:signal transduction histidine kinase
MRLYHLSLRYKIPLWGVLLIVVSVLAVSAALMAKAYGDLRQDLRISAEGLGHTLTQTLFPALLHDDVWRAFEQINAAFAGRHVGNPVQPEAIFVVDAEGRIVVSSSPRDLPVLARLDSLGRDYARLAAHLARAGGEDSAAPDFANAARLFFVFPIREESAHMGTLVLAYSKNVFLPRFQGLALYGILIGGLVLAVLLPINWYWGQRMARPLVDLARRMGRAVHGGLDEPPHEVYPYQDELGQLFQAFDAMLGEMREKSLLERELLQSERLTAIGRLASGIAHEVNNPLGGMLMALDNLKQRGGLPEHALKTLGLLERGLKQIQETVAALLVQARDQSRALTPHDLEDVRTLIHPQVLKKSQHLEWRAELPQGVQLPAAACRQILINLLLNAVQATAEQGRIGVSVAQREGGLSFAVVNQAPPIPTEHREHLFEPFVSGREGGHGLGLWVTYQIVQQLGGHIAATCADGEVRFEAWLPLNEEKS